MQSQGRLRVCVELQGLADIEYNMLKANSLLPETETGDPQQQFQLLDMLGQGAYGSVSKALHKATGQLYAIKILSATSLSQINAIKKEIQILRLCDNQYIVKYYGSYFKDNNLWIVLEYCHAGSIIDLLNITQKKLTENEIASILESVLKGLVYLHEHKKIHRDIKAANILLNKEGLAKLADFGVSAQSMYTNAGHRSQVGSPYWMSPEVMKHSQYTNKTDIWSLGVTAIELAEGVVPNSHLKPLIAMWQLKDKPIQGFKEPSKWSNDYNSFVKDCLNVNPHLRSQARTLLSHPFIVNYSKGQSLLAELVQRSLADIEEFRLGQDKSQSQGDLMEMLNRSLAGQTRTIVNNRTERSRESKFQVQQEGLESSMIVNEVNGSMIINENDNSMVEVERKEQPKSFLNKYISDLKSTENEIDSQKDQIRKKIQDCDEGCLKDLESVFIKHKTAMATLLQNGLNEQFFGLDPNFVKTQLKSRLHTADTMKDFIQGFPQYKEVKQFQRSQLAKKKSASSQMAHHSTQTNDPGSGDLAQFREIQPRGVKSQQFPQKQFKTTQKHCFNSKSIISDMENVKYSKDFQQDDSRSKVVRRFIVTEPYDWGAVEPRPALPIQDKAKLKQQFFNDPDVKESILSHIHALGRTEEFKYDRVAQSTLYHDWAEDSGGLKHQHSVTLVKSNNYPPRNHYSQQEYLMPHEQFDEEDTEINVNLFNPKNSAKLSKNNDSRSNKRKKDKRPGVSAQKRGQPKPNTSGVRQKSRPHQK